MEAFAPVAAMFVLSLVGAVILFRFFKSTALIRQKTYQAGGALAGFVIIYGLLFTSFYRFEQLKNQELSRANDDLKKQVGKLELAVVSGVVEPDRGPVKVRLVFDALEPDSTQGRFNFQVPRVLLDNATMALSAVTDDEHVILDSNCPDEKCVLPESFVYLFGQKLDNVKIPVKLKRK
jgi:hypothetical protein